VKNSKTTSYKISVKASKTYYVRVRAYKKSGNSHVYGAWSVSLSNNYSKLYATYTTNYVNNADRTTNLKLACEAINGTIVQPGETFSFNKVVGKRTASKGYKNAHIFTGANSSQMGLGGGICQVASTMFNTTLLANFDIVERYQHSQRVTYVPLGRDAAIYWGSEDFKFKNTTNYPIKIVMSCKNGKITCSFYTCQNISPKKVSLKVTQKGKNFTLKRYVDGKVNYTTKSKY
jgi:vancomycin resistance protein YoaR